MEIFIETILFENYSYIMSYHLGFFFFFFLAQNTFQNSLNSEHYQSHMAYMLRFCENSSRYVFIQYNWIIQMFSEHFSSILFQKKKQTAFSSVLYLRRLRKLLQKCAQKHWWQGWSNFCKASEIRDKQVTPTWIDLYMYWIFKFW